MHQNVWQRVNGLCPDPYGLRNPREGRKKGLTEGARWPQAWTAPQDLGQIAATASDVIKSALYRQRRTFITKAFQRYKNMTLQVNTKRICEQKL